MMRRPGPPTPEQQVEKIFTSYLQKKDPEMRFLIFNNANEEQKKCLKQFMVSQPYFDKRAFYLHSKEMSDYKGDFEVLDKQLKDLRMCLAPSVIWVDNEEYFSLFLGILMMITAYTDLPAFAKQEIEQTIKQGANKQGAIQQEAIKQQVSNEDQLKLVQDPLQSFFDDLKKYPHLLIFSTSDPEIHAKLKKIAPYVPIDVIDFEEAERNEADALE